MKYPIGIQNFGEIRRDGYVYVDKTALVYKMVSEGKYYFLSRPRRFGKSLLMSTIEAYLSGKKELFEGLAIETLEQEWIEYPVLHMDLNSREYKDESSLEAELNRHLEGWEKIYGDNYKDRATEERFLHVIDNAYEKTGRRVVILVDEYDKPLLQTIGKEELQSAYRSKLKAFYSVLKTQDAKIRFAFLTGVTKFGKVSVFSDLNNLNDISMSPLFHNICGITDQELQQYFSESIDNLSRKLNVQREACIEKLRKSYDGYHFEENSNGLYNPFSLLNTFYNMKFGSYWFATGTPTYLVNLLQQYDYNLDFMSKAEVSADVLNSVEPNSQNPIPVIYQSGYLTIKGYDSEFGDYKLGFPNEEVEEGFVKYLAPFYLSKTQSRSAFDVRSFVSDVRSGKAEQFCVRLKSLFSDTPYELVKDLENHYQNIVWVVFKMLGFYSQAEYHTSNGRIDLVISTPDYRYVMEFKLDGTAEEAMEQIKSKNYSLPFALDNKHTYLIGM
ncbi:MAG: AAA family ATPase, partial [Prevotella sp.]|nr:AAA family ATPase [Prevotella sp.]